MVGINLGNVVGNRISGISSGLDTENLIKSLSQIRQRPIDLINTKISTNAAKAAQYGTLNSLLTNLNGAANYLRNPVGLNSQFSNIFNYRTSALTSTTLTASSYLSVTADPGAQIGTSTIEINQLAKALEKRSASFNSRNIDVTTGAAGITLNAGTFQFGSGVVNAVAGTSLSGYEIQATDYATEGSASGSVITAAGINNFAVVGADGGKNTLKGSPSAVSVSNISAGTAILSITIGGATYSTGAVQVDNVVTGGIGIAAGTTFTFTTDSGGVNETSFQITTGVTDFVIDDTQANLDQFGEDIADAISDQVVYQARQITNFTDANVKSPLVGLTSTDIKFYSNAYNDSTRAFGDISGFTVEYGAGNTSAISVNINGETFRVTGQGVLLNGALTLKSITTEKELRIDLTGVNVDLANAADAVELERALDYAFGTRELVDVTVTAGDTLNDVIFNINQLTNQTGVSAAVIKISDFDFKFSLKAVNEGIDNKYEIFDASNVLTGASLANTQTEQDAEIVVDGITISRSSNTVTDAIENVTLNLLAETPGADTIDLAIANDVDTVATQIVNFIDAFNALRVYVTEQSQRDATTNQFLETSILGGDSNLQTLSNSLLSEINGIVSNATNSTFDALADIGITLSDFAGDDTTIATKNILVFDETALKNKLAQNFDKLREVFELKFTSSSSNLAFFKSSNDYTLSEFKLDIDTSRDVGEQVQLLNSDGTEYDSDADTVGIQAVYLDATGNKITGKTGTPVAGLEFIYTGEGTDVISVSLSQGLADRIYNLSNTYVKDAGLLDTAVSDLADQNDDYETDILSLQDRLDQYVERLRVQFSALEQALTSVNNVLQLLDANAAAANKNS